MLIVCVYSRAIEGERFRLEDHTAIESRYFVTILE